VLLRARLISLAGVVLLAAACASPVGVTRVDTLTGYRLHAESALTAERLSDPSMAVLRRAGLLDRFEQEPATVLAEMHRGLSPAGDQDRLFALAELSFLTANVLAIAHIFWPRRCTHTRCCSRAAKDWHATAPVRPTAANDV